MGQRPTSREGVGRRPPESTWTVFDTLFGWTALERCDAGVLRVLIGCRSKHELSAALPAGVAVSFDQDLLTDRIQNYFAGMPDEFDEVPLAATWSTPFQRTVVRALRQVRYGETTTYGELARRVGRPAAARAVGQVMATNPVPLLVPCHRVLGAGGALGGFSAPTGIALKKRLLQLEARPNVSRTLSDLRDVGVALGGRRR